MKKIIVSNLISVDGFFAGPKGELDWHVVDEEFNEYAVEMLDLVSTLLFGKTTYNLMAAYWPTEEAVKEDDPLVAARMNSLPKIVFSKTLARADWANSQVLAEIDPEEIKKMKEGDGQDLLILGSGSIVRQFADLDLIDEYRIMVGPVILGQGQSLFAGLKQRTKLKLLKTKVFHSGNVLLYYQPVN